MSPMYAVSSQVLVLAVFIFAAVRQIRAIFDMPTTLSHHYAMMEALLYQPRHLFRNLIMVLSLAAIFAFLHLWVLSIGVPLIGVFQFVWLVKLFKIRRLIALL